MSIATYDELKAAVADWLERSDLDSRIPDFITLAEAKINRTLRHPNMEIRATASTVSTSDEPQFLSLPSDFQSMRSLRLSEVSGAPSLEFRSEAQLARYRTSIGNTAGIPRYFTVFGDELEMAPTPDADYTLEMVYRGDITALSSDDTTNWVLEAAPDVYLYGALLQAAPYADPEKVPLWAAAYNGAFDELVQHGRKLKYGPTPIQITLAGQATP